MSILFFHQGASGRIKNTLKSIFIFDIFEFRISIGSFILTTSEIMIKIANSFKNEISDFNGLYLYGSRAKQMNSILSDYDVIFLSKRKLLSDEKSAIYKIVGKIEFEMDIFIDIQILTMEELLKNRFFYEEVTKYGQFYAA